MCVMHIAVLMSVTAALGGQTLFCARFAQTKKDL
jgi:hypothetical protein